MRIDRGSLHPLRSDRDFSLFRATLLGEGKTVLLLGSTSGSMSAVARNRLTHEYALANQLDPAWAARPLAMTEYEGQPALVLEDTGGDPLSPSTTGPLPLERFLHVAVGAAVALRGTHGKGLIHKDIKPANLLVDSTGVVRLTGFGIASQILREQQQLAAPESIHGTLAYMAPEQTGRMNRSVDARSDLYALGVSFYEMLCGSRPFEANAPLEWVHCHVARTPAPLVSRVTDLPDPVNGIVMKLLSKSAEDRYQTAGSLEMDLSRCLEAVERGVRPGPFLLGEADMPDHLVIPERLYGREDEIAVLAAAFAGVVESGRSRVALVSGYSGIGKSAVVNELRPISVRLRGLMASGKFDQFHRDVPYSTVGEVFRNITQRVLGTPPEERERWRQALQKELGGNGEILVNLVPEIEFLLGKQPPAVELSPRDAEIRFQRVVRQFLGVFVQAGYPLLLFIDDMQWLDSASLALLKALFDDSAPRSLLLVGAYRSNEVGQNHPLRQTMQAMRESGVEVEELHLGPLRLEDIVSFAADALRTSRDQVASLAALIHEKTAGNPFFVGQFMTALADEGLLWFDHSGLQWAWDIDRIRAKGFTDNVADLLVGRLDRLAPETRALLTTFACLGASANAERLCLAQGESLEDIQASLQKALAAGLILQADDSYSFVHDRIQEAAHALLPPEQLTALHLRIGRRLARGLRQAGREDAVFLVVDQYNRCLDLVSEQEERDEVAALNLLAGQRARASTAFAAALTYLEMGKRWLGDAGREQVKRLVFDLGYHAAECRFLTGDHATAEAELLALGEGATALVDRALIASQLVKLFTALDRSDRAVETCLMFLRDLGIDWSAHPGANEPLRAYSMLTDRLGSRSVKALADQPWSENLESHAILDVLAEVLPPAFFTDQDLVCLVLCHMANYSLDHGNCDASPLCYAYLGMVIGPYFGDYKAGFAFGQLGRDLVEARGLRRYAARVEMCFAYHVAPWTRHISFSLPLLRRAFEIAVQTGDLTYSGFSACTTITTLLAAGMPLGDVQREAEAKLDFVRRAKFGLIDDIITSQLGLIRSLRGLTPHLTSFDESGFEAKLVSQPGLMIAACWHWIRKLQAAVLGSAYKHGLEAAAKAEPLLWTTAGHLEMAEYHFYAALAHAGCCDGSDDAANRTALAAHQEQLRVWAGNCPENFGARAAMVAAAAAALEGDNFEAMRHFEDAIRSSRENRMVHVEALAHEWAARFYQQHGFTSIAITYMRSARDCYLEWGATTKVQQLEQLNRELRAAPTVVPAAVEPQLEMLDLAGLIRASEAVSGEIGLRKLIDTLMVVVAEHAGVERGLLLLPRGEDLRLEAEAQTGPNGIEVLWHEVPVSGAHAPLALLHHVIRTQDVVLLDDAQRPNRYSEEPYFAGKACRSVLCIPLLKQGKLTGILYLENSLAPHVFTPARVAVLQLLASQAAISLESAALEEKEALLREMHHRVKNNLQLISSLLNLQASRVDDPALADLFADSRDRVRSMALVHENLYRAGDYARVPMRRHIELLCAQLERAYRPQGEPIAIVLEIEDLQFDLDRAVPCGLIINELVSNAFKHAFPHGRAGKIVVSLTREDERYCRLVVKDDGVGFATGVVTDPDTAPTLGLQLVGDLVHQLHGTVELDQASGIAFVVFFRMAAEKDTTISG